MQIVLPGVLPGQWQVSAAHGLHAAILRPVSRKQVRGVFSRLLALPGLLQTGIPLISQLMIMALLSILGLQFYGNVIILQTYSRFRLCKDGHTRVISTVL